MRASTVDRWVKKWRRRFGVSMPYTITWKDHSHPKTDPNNAGETTYAETGWGHAGEEIDIIIYPEFKTDTESDQIKEKIILHELLHPTLNCHDEFVINKVTELLWKAYESD